MPFSFIEVLREPKDAIFRAMADHLRAAYPDHSLFMTERSPINIQRFADEGHCQVAEKPEVPSDFVYSYNTKRESMHAQSSETWQCVEWQGYNLEVITLGIRGEFRKEFRQMFLASSREIAEGFYIALAKWEASVKGEVLVFDDGGFSKSEELFDQIQSATFENLILANDLKEQIQQDLRGFLESKEMYARHHIPWKRGILLLGPPGNGKTHTVKALINWLQVPCIYVRSLEQERGTPQASLSKLFEHAREVAPCVMILEDLDALVNDKTRSYFLNELDGFSANEGIVVIASTNHPDKLDPAILDRPSRFDRKYTFELPEFQERQTYLRMMTAEFGQEMALSEEDISAIANETTDYSFAYLKELILSAMMAWISQPHEDLSVRQVIEAQVQTLRSQMVTEMNSPGQPTARPHSRFSYDDDDEDDD